MQVELPAEFGELKRAARRQLGTTPARASVGPGGARAGAERWPALAGSGWTGLLAADGSDPTGLYATLIVLAELGRVLAPEPIRSTNLVASALAAAGGDHGERLEGLVTGELVGVWVPIAAGDPGTSAGAVEAVPIGGGYRLDGSVVAVEDGMAADVLLLTIRTPAGFAQVVVPVGAPGVTRRALEAMDLTRSFATVELDGVFVPPEDVVVDPPDGLDAYRRQLDTGTLLQGAELVGAMERLFELTLEYAKERKAFGRTIGSFQVIKHRLVDMLLAIETGKAAIIGAAREWGGPCFGDEASIATWHVATSGPSLARQCLQIHGGVGFTWESDVHLYLRRIESGALLLGTAERHLDRIAGSLLGPLPQAGCRG